MAYTNPTFLSAVTCTTAGGVFYAIKEHLKLAGWVTDGSGDAGALYSSAGVDHITNNGTGAGGFDRVNAWWAGHFGSRFLMIQAITITIGTAATDSRLSIMYGRSAFNYAGASTSIAPTGGEGYILGGAGTGQQFIEWSDPTVFLMGAADQAGVGAFWFAAMEDATNSNAAVGFMMEEVSGDPNDTDPVVFYAPGGNNTASLSGFSKALVTDNSNVLLAQCRALYYEGTGSEAWRPAPAYAYESSTNEIMVDVTSYTASAYDGVFMCQKMGFGTNQTALKAWKGVAKSVAFLPVSDSVGTGRREVYTHQTANDYIRFVNSLLPWDGSIPTVPLMWVSGGDIRFTESTPDAVAPVVGNFEPAAGADVVATTEISFDVTDESGLAIVAIIASFPDGTVDVVYDGFSFRDKYTSGVNEKVAITGGFRFTLLRRGGWIGSPTFEYLVVDSGGNVGELA